MKDNRTPKEREADRLADIHCSGQLLEYSRSAYERQAENFNRLDSKSATLAGFIGIVLTVTIGQIDIQGLAQTYSNGDWPARCFSVLVAATTLLLAAALLLCLFVIRTRDTMQPLTATQALALYRTLGRPSFREQLLLKQLTVSLSRAEEHRLLLNKRKASVLKYSTLCLIGSIGTAIFACFIQALYYPPQ